MLENLSKTYNPKEFEDRLYKYWNDNGYFTPKVDKEKEAFTIVMPPPNVTGSLHMGHAHYCNATTECHWKLTYGPCP